MPARGGSLNNAAMSGRRPRVIASSVTLLLVAVLAGGGGGGCAVDVKLLPGLSGTKYGPVHVFHLEAAPDFLSDSMAVEMAGQTMRLDGYDLTQWHLAGGSTTVAPDASKDVNLERRSARSGYVKFVREGKTPRYVAVLLDEDQVKCQVVEKTKEPKAPAATKPAG